MINHSFYNRYPINLTNGDCPDCLGTGYDFSDGGQCSNCEGTGDADV